MATGPRWVIAWAIFLLVIVVALFSYVFGNPPSWFVGIALGLGAGAVLGMIYVSVKR